MKRNYPGFFVQIYRSIMKHKGKQKADSVRQKNKERKKWSTVKN